MINYDLTQIRAIVFDVDGVLSCSTIPMDSRGEPVRTINIKDGYAIQLAEKHGLRIAIMTGGHNEDIRLRYEYLGVEDVYLSCAVKVRTWGGVQGALRLARRRDRLCRDDIPDYEVMQLAGCACCPKDACQEVKDISTYVSDRPGGQGVARDVIEQVLKAQGKWVLNAKAFGW